MECRDCLFLSKPKKFAEGDFPAVRCTLGLWDNDNKEGVAQWYSYGSSVRNRGPIRKHGKSCGYGQHKF